MNVIPSRSLPGRSAVFRVSSLVILALGLLSLPTGARAQLAVDPEADRIVRSMAAYLGGLRSFTAEFDIDVDHVTHEGEKLQFSAWGKVSLVRPDRVHVERHGGFADLDMYYDGKDITIHGRRENVYAQMAASGSVGDAVDALRAETGFDLPGGDLLFPDVYDVLLADIRSGAYWGTTAVEGINCHYVAFRGDRTDVQLWIRAGDKPLLMKLVLTSKWFSGAPQYALRLRNWQENATIDAARFVFSPPPNARKLDAIPGDLLDNPNIRN